MTLIADKIGYGQEKILLKQISMELNPHQWTVLMGANGAGKSTLINVLGGYFTPIKGQVFLNGQLIENYDIQNKARIVSVLPQENVLDFAFLVKEILSFNTAKLFHENSLRYDLDYLIDVLELEHLLDRNYLTLSAGEQQRVHLVRVINQLHKTHQPSFLLLDEPFAPLDLRHQQKLIKLIRELTRQPIGVLTSIHDVNLAWYADQVILLKKGSIIKADTPHGVLTESLLEQTYDIKVQLINEQSKDCIVFDLNRE